MDMPHILVIDDDDAVRSAFQLALGSRGYHVRTASDGDAGLAALAHAPADLIFVDLNMPRRSGVEVLRSIRRTDRVTPVFVITAFAETFMSDLKTAAAEGLHFNLLRKPLDVDEIQAAATAALCEPVEWTQGGGV
jgi:CheY-like chemotaxis protein